MSTAQRRRGAHLPHLGLVQTLAGFKQARHARIALITKQKQRKARSKMGVIAGIQWNIRTKFPGSPSGGK